MFIKLSIENVVLNVVVSALGIPTFIPQSPCHQGFRQALVPKTTRRKEARCLAPGGLESGGERPLHSVSPLVFYCICRPPGVFPGYGETQVHVTFPVKEERQRGRERGKEKEERKETL